MECPNAFIIERVITQQKKIGMNCTIIKSRKHLSNYITFAIRHTIMISRAIEFDDPITAGDVLTTKVKKLLKEYFKGLF